MSVLLSMLTQTATVMRYTYTVDERGNQVRVEPPTETDYPCRLEMTDSQEINTGQATEVSNWRLFLPPEADVDAEDRIDIESRIYEVIGPPAVEREPSGPHHIMARLRFVQ